MMARVEHADGSVVRDATDRDPTGAEAVGFACELSRATFVRKRSQCYCFASDMPPIDISPAHLKLAVEAVSKLLQAASRTYGAVHKAWPARMNGTDGYLIWDYIAFNEITFHSPKMKEITSLFTSVSDEKTEARFAELVQEFGVPGDRLMNRRD